MTCSCHAFLTPVLEGGAAVGIELRFPTLPVFVPSFISGLKQKRKWTVKSTIMQSLVVCLMPEVVFKILF